MENANNKDSRKQSESKSKWLKYAAVTPAAAIALGAVDVQAALVAIAPGTQTISGSRLDLDGDTINDIGLFFSQFLGATAFFYAGGAIGEVSETPTSIPTASFSAFRSVSGGTNNWDTPDQHFAFNLSGGGTGWIRLVASSSDLTWTGAFDTSATGPIHVGTTAVPEPSSFAFLGMLALGAAGVSRYRKQQVLIEEEGASTSA